MTIADEAMWWFDNLTEQEQEQIILKAHSQVKEEEWQSK